jgi:hypothetical protein
MVNIAQTNEILARQKDNGGAVVCLPFFPVARRQTTHRDSVSDAAIVNPYLMGALNARYHFRFLTGNQETGMRSALIGATPLPPQLS